MLVLFLLKFQDRKRSTNDNPYARMGDDMNINCGDIISGDVSLADNEQEIYREILRVASGGSTKARNWGLEWSNSCHGKWGR